jgi:hypothetical protein
MIVKWGKLFMESVYLQIRDEFNGTFGLISLDDVRHSYRLFDGNILKHY